MSVLVICKDSINEKVLEQLELYFVGRDISIVVKRYSEMFEESNIRIQFIQSFYLDQNIFFENVSNVHFSEVVLVGFSRQDVLPIWLVSYFLEKQVCSIRLLFGNNLARYSPFKGRKSKTILVFPGSIVPLNMGSHQRAFNLLYALNINGFYTDVIITGNNIGYASRMLESICPNVYTYKNNKSKLPKLLRLRRQAEKVINYVLGNGKIANELFADRLANKATCSLKRTLGRIVNENDYLNIIISYAWMARALQGLDTSGRKIICDTHDVQYIRNKSSGKQNKLSFTLLNKWLEIRTLSKFDSILSISNSDHDELKKQFEKKAVLVTTSFDYALNKSIVPVNVDEIHFGFIGGKMDANVQSLLYILKNWWPKILEKKPFCKLYLAGSICNVEVIQNEVFLDDSVVLLGFVPVLDDFYNKINISLNPVLVQGGLNFKSVEAVFKGKFLLTNYLGSLCLQPADMSWVVKSSSDLDNFLDLITLKKEDSVNLLKDKQNNALNNFSLKKVSTQIKKIGLLE